MKCLPILWLVLTTTAIASDLPRRPNIVILYADDLGYGDLGCYGTGSKIPTPNLDRLAGEGLRFTDAHSSSGICTPSRYALLTGRYHWRKFHGIVNAFGGSVFSSERLTLPEMLRASGYRTACIGKWHLGWNWEALKKPGARPLKVERRNRGFAADAFDWSRPIPGGPLAHGFDHYFGDDVPNFPPYTWIEDDRILKAPTVPYLPDPAPAEGSPEGRPGPMAEGWKQDAVMPALTRHVVEWLGRQKDQDEPFFLYFPWTSPHAPIVPAPEYLGRTEVGGYGDFVHQSDHHAGQVLAALDVNGLGDDTLVIFTADNGPEHYAYPRAREHGHRSAGPLRGLKRDVWEGGHRVPFLVRWPGVVKPGTVSNSLVSQIDLMATLAEIVGFELPADAAEDSESLLALLEGAKTGPREALVHNTFEGKWAIRVGSWLWIDAPNGQHTRVPEWYTEAEDLPPDEGASALFDLAEDLGQRVNIASGHPEVVQQLRSRLKRIRERGHSARRLDK
ncbi:MAG: arylsulfatase [Planctomycetota bacterium]